MRLCPKRRTCIKINHLRNARILRIFTSLNFGKYRSHSINAKIRHWLKNWYSSQVFTFPTSKYHPACRFGSQKNISWKHAFPGRGALCTRLAEFRCGGCALGIVMRFYAWLSRGTEGNSHEGNMAYPVFWRCRLLPFLASNPRDNNGKLALLQRVIIFCPCLSDIPFY